MLSAFHLVPKQRFLSSQVFMNSIDLIFLLELLLNVVPSYSKHRPTNTKINCNALKFKHIDQINYR